jgi:hypothetical protein
MDFLQHTSEIGDIKPKKEQQQAGAGFTINIQFPQQFAATERPATITVDQSMGDFLSSVPSYVRAADLVESLDYVDVAP